jgi:thiol:disulfide interchange protein
MIASKILAPLLLIVAAVAEGFLLSSGPNAFTQRRVDGITLSSAAVEASEWYTPPPLVKPAAAVVPHHRAGGKALQTSLTTKEQLDEFLNNKEDQRLVIVKFYASW